MTTSGRLYPRASFEALSEWVRDVRDFLPGAGAVHTYAEAKDVALAGPDGERVHALLSAAREDVTRTFADKCRSAVTRMMSRPDPLRAPVLFDDAELTEIAAGLGRVVAAADLLGRARIRRRALMAEKAGQFAEGGDDPFHDFAEPIPPLAPQKALEYVRARVPVLDPSPDRYGPRLDRYATAVAIAADETLLARVKDAVAKELEGGGDATPDIDEILRSAGVIEDDPQYPEMIARTNAVSALNAGAMDELATPEMREVFPAWEYAGILDSRTGDDHRPRIGKYYPSSARFEDVRGPRIWNCRCSFTPVHRSRMGGVRVEERW